MLQCLLEEEVKFLLVGAYALAAHGFPRATKDIDFFVWATPDNSASLMKALARFGAPLHDVSAADFASEGDRTPHAAYHAVSNPTARYSSRPRSRVMNVHRRWRHCHISIRSKGSLCAALGR